MPPVVEVTKTDIEWLTDNFDHLHIAEIAARFGCCVDTAKRICARNGLGNFTGAKYTPLPEVKMWNRPCQKCGDTAPRPKWQYRCDRCKAAEDIFGVDERWIY